MAQPGCLRQAWSGGCFGYVVELQAAAGGGVDDETARAAVRAAFATWLSVDCGGSKPPSLRVFDLGATECDRGEYHADAPNTNSWTFTDRQASGTEYADAYAITVRHFDDAGALLDADVEVRAALLEGVDLHFVLTHEAGHVLGLNHSVTPGSWMAPGYQPASAATGQLHDDDVSAICAAYPPDRPRVSCDPAAGGGPFRRCGPSEVVAHGCTSCAGHRPPGELSAAFVALLLGFARSRGRRR